MKMTREQYYDIRSRKDAKYENTFFIGSWSRGVFCNVTCPDYPPEDKNDLVYFSNIYEAMEAGLVPCKDCEPDMHSDQIRLNVELSNEVNNAVNLIDEGYLNMNTISDMAKKLFMSERHLRRLFEKQVGVSPTKLALYQRAFFAKKLIYETEMKMADIAFASGFNSIRDFNHVFRTLFNETPSDIRKESTQNRCGTEDVMYIPYYEGFDYKKSLQQIKENLIPGVETIEDEVYKRHFTLSGISGHLSVEDEPEESHLKLSLNAQDKRCYMGVYHRIQRMLGLMDKLSDAVLGFDPYEVSIRVILEALCEEGKADMVQKELIEKSDLDMHRMTDEIIDSTDSDDNTKAFLKSFNHALRNNSLTLAYNQSYDRFSNEMARIKGCSQEIIDSIAVKGLGLTK